MTAIPENCLNVYHLESANPWLNLATEEYFLTTRLPGDRDASLLFYENSDSIILGRSLKKEEEIFLHKARIPVLRRISGGGSVVHFRGNLNYSLIVSLLHFKDLYPIKKSYRAVLSSISDSFSASGMQVFQRGLSDLAVMQRGELRKVSGNSQARKKNMLLHHGTFLYHTRNRNKVSYFLKNPEKQPEYRGNRDHNDFLLLCNLPDLSRSSLVRILINAFEKLFQARSRVLKLPDRLSEEDKANTRKLIWRYGKG